MRSSDVLLPTRLWLRTAPAKRRVTKTFRFARACLMCATLRLNESRSSAARSLTRVVLNSSFTMSMIVLRSFVRSRRQTSTCRSVCFCRTCWLASRRRCQVKTVISKYMSPFASGSIGFFQCRIALGRSGNRRVDRVTTRWRTPDRSVTDSSGAVVPSLFAIPHTYIDANGWNVSVLRAGDRLQAQRAVYGGCAAWRRTRRRRSCAVAFETVDGRCGALSRMEGCAGRRVGVR